MSKLFLGWAPKIRQYAGIHAITDSCHLRNLVIESCFSWSLVVTGCQSRVNLDQPHHFVLSHVNGLLEVI